MYYKSNKGSAPALYTPSGLGWAGTGDGVGGAKGGGKEDSSRNT